MGFPELPQLTPVVVGIIKALYHERYDEIMKQWTVQDRYEKGKEQEHKANSLKKHKRTQ